MATNWNDVEAEMQGHVRDILKQTRSRAESCTVRASNELRNAALEVLRGQRSGRVYRLPHSSSYYTASAPGEPPAVRTGMLRMSWGLRASGDGKGNYVAAIQTQIPYAPWLENGTNGKHRMAPRPYKEKIIEMATPGVNRIFSEITK